uniref:CX domain-containing protein n=1 Tax=Wuchereria bancrofti TaxID=6293 RepID=A0AAF5RU96_WUCBA
MDLLLQSKSRGIRYEGYDDDFIQCVFEDSNVSGRNERYEFRCRPNLECCGRTCCIPQENIIPLWLMILFIILGLLLLAALLGTIFWFLRKMTKQNKSLENAKKARIIKYQPATLGYRSYKQNESQEGLGTENLIQKEKDDLYSTPNDTGTLRSMRGKHGYRNPLYTTTTSTVKIRETFDRTIDDTNNSYDKSGTDTDTGIGTGGGGGGEITGRSEITMNNDNQKQLNTAGIRRNEQQIAEPISLPNTNSGQLSGNSSGHYSTRETFEERCEENYIAEEKKSSPYPNTKELL